MKRAPTIPKKQQTKALSAKRHKKETIKNVLKKPFVNYWPQLVSNDNSSLIKVLNDRLPRLKHEKISVPYAEIKEIPKSERKQFRQKFSNQAPTETIETNLVFGVNDVSRLLEQKEAASILVDGGVNPRLLVQHVIDQAVLYRVPILVVTDLKKTLLMKCGISGATIALKEGFPIESDLGIIHKQIYNKAQKYPVPTNHINYDRSRQLSSKKSEKCQLSSIERKDCTIILHLKRQSRKDRAFVPELSKPLEHSTMEIDCNSFIPLSDGTSKADNANTTTKYKSLIVKRLRGNRNRGLTKIIKMKRNEKLK